MDLDIFRNVKDLTWNTKWGNISAQRTFMDDLGKKLNITSQEEWYKLTTPILRFYGGQHLLPVYNYSPSKLLKAVYPEYPRHYDIIFQMRNFICFRYLGCIKISTCSTRLLG